MRLPILLSGVLLLAACGASPQAFHFDNPTGQPLKLQIDGQAHEIPAHAETVAELAAGAHTLQTAQLGTVRFTVYAGHDGALVNPTLSDYYLVDEVYWTAGSRPVEYQGDQTIMVDGVELAGRYRQVNGLFLDKDWDFAVHQPFPEVSSGTVDTSGGRRMRKIFAHDDFVAYYERSHQQPGYIAAHRPADWRAPSPTLVSDTAPLPTLAAPLQAHTAPMRQLVTAYLHATDPGEQQRLQKQYVRTQIQFTQATAGLQSGLSVADNARANAFVDRASRIMSSAALVTSP